MNFDLSKALTLLDGTVVYLSTICGHLILADNDTSQDQIQFPTMYVNLFTVFISLKNARGL